jgi:hypothetical protein
MALCNNKYLSIFKFDLKKNPIVMYIWIKSSNFLQSLYFCILMSNNFSIFLYIF